MSTFLQLCQGVARESGTISGTLPTSVVSQSGRLLSIVKWTAEAWLRIQNMHASWLWMRKEFPATALTSSGTARYTGASWNITDLAEWIIEPRNVSIYLNATGVSDETELTFISWDQWRITYGRGTQTNNRPINYTISPAGEFCLGPIPDAIYRLNGEYRKTPQILSANADIPECPTRFHDAIMWLAVSQLAEFDEATPVAIVSAAQKFNEFLFAMRRDQLPQVEIGSDPLA